MSGISIESLGFTKEELKQRVVDQLCAQIMESKTFDEDGDEATAPTAFSRRMKDHVLKTVNARIDAIAEVHVVPNVTAFVDSVMLQETNKWGEKTAKPLTLIEYLVQRADYYIREPVDINGKTKAEDAYNWRQSTTRVAHLIDQHFKYAIDRAMQEALKAANSSIAGGIQDAVKHSLAGILQNIKTSVTVK